MQRAPCGFRHLVHLPSAPGAKSMQSPCSSGVRPHTSHSFGTTASVVNCRHARCVLAESPVAQMSGSRAPQHGTAVLAGGASAELVRSQVMVARAVLLDRLPTALAPG